MIDWASQTVLVIAPHADDEVIGVGGLLAKVTGAGGRVYVRYLSVGATKDFSAKGVSSVDERLAEIEQVARHFSFDGWDVLWRSDAVHLRLDTMAQKDLIGALERGSALALEELRPDVVLFPLPNDYNQDHRAAARAMLAACRPAPPNEKFTPRLIFSYEAPMSAWSVAPGGGGPQVIVALSEDELQKKIAGMEFYTSQRRGPGHPRHEDALRALARVRGSLIGMPYGEAFFCHRFMV